MAAESFLAKCKQFFDSANGGKPLTPGALCRAIRQANPDFQGTDQDIADMFFEFDVNNDKLISWEEFQGAVTRKDPKEVTRAELAAVFKERDKDGSGLLSKEEIRSFIQSFNLKISEETLNRLIDEADHNKDGQISYEEFLQAWFCQQY